MGTLTETAQAIRSMRIRGAAPLAVAAATALGNHLGAWPGSLPELQAEARRAGRLLMATRPTAVSLEHALSTVVAAVLEAGDERQARQGATTAATGFAARVRESEHALARAGAPLIQSGQAWLTHCHSSSVVAIFREARRHADFQVYATETRPFRQGLVTVRALAEAGVQATLVVDSAAWTVLERVQGVLVGADTVAADGTLFN
ncbi:MAG: eIF2B alpha/beta/delta subunit family protein, partial [Thermoplasmatota archaeon]